MKKFFGCICFILFILLGSESVQGASDISFKIEMLPWKNVDKLLPRYTKFTVMDLETGKQFRVQRRAGSHHADVQPLTSKDTKMMKKIYGGKWSWKRRAIIVVYKDQWIAASMHGMPHGAGSLRNNFPGHFCIHFFGSTTHRTNSMDIGHMLMIYKAAGKLDTYLEKANPYEVVEAYITGLKQQDKRIVEKISLQKLKWRPIFQQVENVKISRLPLLPPEDLINQISLEIPIEVDWYLKNVGRQIFKGEIHLIRFSQFESWRVDSVQFLKDNHLK
ncbi:MAG: hypothetical protein Q8934_03105 [Bacillota bacterium]|nr:hypothetical protein [Bacillota bacterium]